MKPTLFIIEGPDCTGKTTLGKFMVRELMGCYIHSTGDRRLHAGMQPYHESQIKTAKTTIEIGCTDVVMDRHWISEWCYGRALQRPDNGYSFDHILRQLEELNPVYIIAESDKACDRQMVDNNHVPLPRSEFMAVCGEYRMMYDILKKDSSSKDPLASYMQNQVHARLVARYCIEDHGHVMGDWFDKLMEMLQ